MEQATFCCVQCRLLQPPTTACSECGTSMVAPITLVRELLQYRDMKLVNERDWAFITAMIAGGSIAFPVLAPVAIGSMVVLGVTKLRDIRRRTQIAGVELPPLSRAPGARTVIGTARRFRSTVASQLRDGQVLVEHAVVTNREGGVLIRHSASATFLLDRGSAEEPLLVTGALRLVAPGLFGTAPLREPVKRGDPRLRRMGVPADFAIAGNLAASTLLDEDGDDLQIAVTGVIEHEAVADLAFHRDGGTIPVMRGIAGAPVLIEDGRLLAVSLAR